MAGWLGERLPETKQSFWDLAVIQLTGLASLPVLASSILLLQRTNFNNAISTLVIGNVLLWIIRYAVIKMGHKGRKSTLDITFDYAGKIGAFFIAIVLLLDTLAWFVVQTTLASNSLMSLFDLHSSHGINRFIQVSVLIGGLSTLLCMGGVTWLKKISILSFPVLVVCFIGLLALAPPVVRNTAPMPFSLAGLALILGTNLGVTADLPTFFRHSKSWEESLRGLTFIQLVTFAIGIGGLFLARLIDPDLGVIAGTDGIEKVLLTTLICFSVICANVANVYSASVGWELLAPKSLVGRKEYMILGFGLTIIFIVLAGVFSLQTLLNVADASLVNLCFIFLFGYLMRLAIGRSPQPFEQRVYFMGWLVATLINVLQYLGLVFTEDSVLVVGVSTILLSIFGGFILFETRKRLKD